MLAFLFPGQGSQAVEMGKEAAAACPEARAVFDEADRVLGLELSRLCFEGPEEELRRTEVTQPAMLTTSVALWAVLRERGIRPDAVAGHSLGEYSAIVAAGGLSFADAVRTVQLRGRYMQEAVPEGVGAMAAFIGLEPARVEAICREQAGDDVLEPANYNAPDQTVISGHAGAVERAVAAADDAGATRAVRLPVSAPFHCSLMDPARERLRADLEALSFRDLEVPLLSNVDAEPVRDAARVRDGLIRQVSAPVRWHPAMVRGVAEGMSRALEIGPGRVLCGLMRRIDRSVRCTPVSDPSGIDKACEGDEA